MIRMNGLAGPLGMQIWCKAAGFENDILSFTNPAALSNADVNKAIERRNKDRQSYADWERFSTDIRE